MLDKLSGLKQFVERTICVKNRSFEKTLSKWIGQTRKLADFLSSKKETLMIATWSSG